MKKFISYILNAILVLMFLGILSNKKTYAQSQTNFINLKVNNSSFGDLAPTPPMGWNSWNHFGCDISEKLIMEVADAMVNSGMKDAGYEYINLDDCWMAKHRDKDGNLIADAQRFPHGMKYLADYIHSKGLKIGLYSSAGTETCAGWPASLDHEVADAKMFAKWGIDYLKYDNCNSQGRPELGRYLAMRNALNDAGRPIVFSVCEWGSDRPWEWAPTLGNLWRTTGDISDNWNSLMVILDQQVGLDRFAGPGHWNDPDMLEVGNGGMTNTEYETHFSLWCMLAAPLISGNDLRHMSDQTLSILTNRDVIAIDQDPLGKEGFKIKDYGDQEVWVKPLSGGDWAVLLFNRGDYRSFMTFELKDLDIKNSGFFLVSDLWSHKVEKRMDGLIRSYVAPHGVKMYRVSVK